MKQNYFREAHDSISAHHMSGERYVESIDKTIADLQEHIRQTEGEIEKLRTMRNVMVNMNAVEYHREEPEMPAVNHLEEGKGEMMDDKISDELVGHLEQVAEEIEPGPQK